MWSLPLDSNCRWEQIKRIKDWFLFLAHRFTFTWPWWGPCWRPIKGFHLGSSHYLRVGAGANTKFAPPPQPGTTFPPSKSVHWNLPTLVVYQWLCGVAWQRGVRCGQNHHFFNLHSYLPSFYEQNRFYFNTIFKWTIRGQKHGQFPESILRLYVRPLHIYNNV